MSDFKWCFEALDPCKVMPLVLELDRNRSPAVYAIYTQSPTVVKYSSGCSPAIYFGMTRGSEIPINFDKRRFNQTFKGLAWRLALHRANGNLDIFKVPSAGEEDRIHLGLAYSFLPSAKLAADWEAALLCAFRHRHAELPLINLTGAKKREGYNGLSVLEDLTARVSRDQRQIWVPEPDTRWAIIGESG